jgi:hypothetical protein
MLKYRALFGYAKGKYIMAHLFRNRGGVKDLTMFIATSLKRAIFQQF